MAIKENGNKNLIRSHLKDIQTHRSLIEFLHRSVLLRVMHQYSHPPPPHSR